MLIAGLLLVWLSSILLRGFVRTNPAVLAQWTRKGGAAVALGLAVVLILRGEFNLALVSAGFGAWLLGRGAISAPRTWGTGFAARRTRGTPMRIRTRTLDVVVDPLNGTVQGRFLVGPFAGRPLAVLSPSEALAAYRWCLGVDPDGARLMEADLDGRFPGWRDADNFAGDAGGPQTAGGARRTAGMPDHEAYHVLGLREGASREEIARAHRKLMKTYHPDHGGSNDLAARVNQAKDVLMRRHPSTRYTQ